MWSSLTLGGLIGFQVIQEETHTGDLFRDRDRDWQDFNDTNTIIYSSGEFSVY